MTHEQTNREKRTVQMLESGRTIRLPACHLLARCDKNGCPKKTVKVSAPDYTLRLPMDEFLELYGDCEAFFLQEQTGIDAKKDEEYYAWRRTSQ